MTDPHFFNIAETARGIARELGPGINTRIFVGDNVMISLVQLDPEAQGQVHSHPEEQWGFMLEGTALRVQGGAEVAVKAGDFWQTPGGVVHGIKAGPEGALILDVFSPPREEYRKAGKGFAVD